MKVGDEVVIETNGLFCSKSVIVRETKTAWVVELDMKKYNKKTSFSTTSNRFTRSRIREITEIDRKFLKNGSLYVKLER